MIRLVMVSALHPATGLVGSVRFWRLAEELAFLGHHVVLLTSRCGEIDTDTVETLRRRFISHDWHNPLVVTCGPDLRLDRRSTGSISRYRLIGRFRTAWDLLVHGGPFWRWRAEARLLYQILREHFDPNLCFATFGNLDALGIARELAKACEIPWVMDIKDPADAFLPSALRSWLMRPYRDAAAVTLNANFQRLHNPGWARADARVIYSGVEAMPESAPDVDPNRYALVGAVYDDKSLFALLQGFGRHLETQSSEARLVYYGKDTARVQSAVESTGLGRRVDCAGMIDRQALLTVCASAAAICYVGYAGTFHHKLLELAALGRPLIVCPDESEEGWSLVQKHQIQMTGSADDAEIASALKIAALTPSRSTSELQESFGWSTAARQVEELFCGLLRQKERFAP